jgi:putative mycofactocin binding protein MftB
MIYRLAKGVQVRKEDWGLLFYSPGEHKIYFAKSDNSVWPLCSDGRFQPDSLCYDEADGPGSSPEAMEHSVLKLITYLVERGIIVDKP